MKKWIRHVPDRIDDGLRYLCGRMSPDVRLVCVVAMLTGFGCLSIYMTVSSIYRIRALWSGVKSCVPRGALVISAIVFPTSLPLWFDHRFDMKKLRPLASRLVPENARDGENSVVPPLLNRLYGHSSGSTREIPLTREGFGPVSSLGRTSRLIGCPSSRVRSQTAFSRGGPSLVRSPGILLPF